MNVEQIAQAWRHECVATSATEMIVYR